MTPERLSSICTLLYGKQWQTPLAQDLGASDRTIRRWAKSGSPEWADKEIMRFCKEAISSLKEFIHVK